MIKPDKPQGVKLIYHDFGQVSCFENKVTQQELSPKVRVQLKQFIDEKYIKDLHKPIIKKSSAFSSNNQQTEQILPIKNIKILEANYKNQECKGWPIGLDLSQRVAKDTKRMIFEENIQRPLVKIIPKMTNVLSNEMPSSFKNQYTIKDDKKIVKFKNYPEQIRNTSTISLNQNQQEKSLSQHKDLLQQQISFNRTKSIYSEYANQKAKIKDLNSVPKQMEDASQSTINNLKKFQNNDKLKKLSIKFSENLPRRNFSNTITNHSLKIKLRSNSNSSYNQTNETGMNLTKNPDIIYDYENQQFVNDFNKKLNVQSIYEKLDQGIQNKDLLKGQGYNRKRFLSFKQ